NRRVHAVIQRGVINQLADRSLAAFDVRDDAVHALQQHVHVLQAAVRGPDHIVISRLLFGLQYIAILHLWACGARTVDVDVSLAQHSGGREQGDRVLTQEEIVLPVDLHRYFHGSLRVVWNDADVFHIADVNAAQTYRRAFAQAVGIREIGFD